MLDVAGCLTRQYKAVVSRVVEAAVATTTSADTQSVCVLLILLNNRSLKYMCLCVYLSQHKQVEPGCVTPLAVANASAKHVLLLLDSKLKSAGRFFVHPIVNSASVLIGAEGLDTFIK